MTQAPRAEAMSREGKEPRRPARPDAASRSWSEVEPRLAKGGWFWLATVRPDGAPHLVPLFAAWAGTVHRQQGSGAQEPQPGS